ncbi:MAG: SigB/SigF/SigG family RNA polymerase sigma factor [Solirubrobacteraceae bacterium]
MRATVTHHPHLQPAHEPDGRELFRRLRSDGDQAAREQLVVRHLSLARKLATRYGRTQEPFEDLFQVACLGLLKAIDRFDPDRGIAFTSFAVPTILGELKRHFRDKGWAVHLPRGLQELVLRIQDADTKLGSTGRRSPTVGEIAEYLNIDTELVLEGLEAIAAHHATSMDQPIEAGQDEGTSTAHDVVGSVDEGYALVDTTASLAAGVKQLRRADREVVALRFRDDLKQSEIAEKIGVSQMQVSRILRRVTDQLRESVDIEPAA